MLVHHMLFLPGLTQYLRSSLSFFFVFLFLFESTVNIFKTISVWRLCLSVKNEITSWKYCVLKSSNVLKYNNLLTQIHFSQHHFEHKTKQTYLKMSFRLEKRIETFISPASIWKNIVSKAIGYMLCHFHNGRVVEAIRHTIYAERIHDQWKQIPYPIWFLGRWESKLSNKNKVWNALIMNRRSLLETRHQFFFKNGLS